MKTNSPTILVEGKYSESDLLELKKRKLWLEKDIYKSQLIELFEINNPSQINKPEFQQNLKTFLQERSGSDAKLQGNYVYYPWSGLLLHMVPEADLRTLRTNRTNNLITNEEQKEVGKFSAGVAGLSFGNGIAVSLVYTGFSETIKIADNDIFETTNLNRVRVGLPSVTEAKTTITAQDIYEINPYADVKVFSNGLTDDNLEEFVVGDKKLNIIFDVVDDLSMKVKLRFAAKRAGIPVVMLTSLEDSVLVDVERFDLEPSAEIFHGLLGPIADDLLTKKMTEQDKAKYAMAIVGPENVSHRNLLSLVDIGKRLVSRPHLYGTVSIVCGLASYVAKRIALGEEMPSMRKLVKFNEILDIGANKGDTTEARQEIIDKMMGKS